MRGMKMKTSLNLVDNTDHAPETESPSKPDDKGREETNQKNNLRENTNKFCNLIIEAAENMKWDVDGLN